MGDPEEERGQQRDQDLAHLAQSGAWSEPGHGEQEPAGGNPRHDTPRAVEAPTP